MLEEIPTEELTPRPRRPRRRSRGEEAQRDKRRDLGRPGLRVLLRRVPRRRLPPAAAPGSQGAAADREHALVARASLADHLMWQLNLQTIERDAAGDRRGDHRQHRRRRVSGRVGERDRGARQLGSSARRDARSSTCRRSTRSASARAICRSACCCRSSTWASRAPPAETLVRDHLRLLQNHRIPELAQARSTSSPRRSRRTSSSSSTSIRSPGSRYSPADSQYVIPDVYIVKTDDGYRAVLNEDGLPQLRISPVYRRLLDKGGESVRRDARVREGQVPLGALAAEVGRSAAEDDPEGRDEHHQLPARLSRLRHRTPAAAGAARRRQRHRHARVDGVARREQQVHAHARRACTR